MKAILLSRGMAALVDDEDYERLSRHKWHATPSPSGKIFYAGRNVTVSIKPRKVLKVRMHNEVLKAGDGFLVDHWNGNGLDNQKSNLRVVSQSVNQQNRTRLTRNTSGYRGVTFHKGRGKWQASIRRFGKKHYLGLHSTREQAAKAYDEGAKRLFGDAAPRLNFPSKEVNTA